MAIELRAFQTQLENDVYRAWNEGARNVMAVSPTGSGKTVIMAKIAHTVNQPTVSIAHRNELVSQVSLALARNGLRHGVIGKGPLVRIISALHMAEFGRSYYDANSKIKVGGVDTAIKLPPSDPIFSQTRLLMQDEGHHVLAKNKWGKLCGMFTNAHGLFPTATPLRCDGRGLGRHADGLVDRMVCGPSLRELIDQGYLTDYDIYAPQSDIDFAKIDVSATTGEFNEKQLRDAVHKSHIVGDVVKHYLKIARGKLGMTFAVDIESAREMTKAYNAAGVRAELVTGETPPFYRAEVLRRFRRRDILQLVNVDLFGEGSDIPALEVISLARPTESFALFTQQFGRVLRLMIEDKYQSRWDSYTVAERRQIIASSAKPKGIVIDHVNNVLRHNGPPDRPIRWSLDSRDKRSAKQEDGIPITTCLNDECLRIYERIYKACPHCGYVRPVAERSTPQQVDGDCTLMSQELLARLRGESSRIMGEFHAPHGLSLPATLGAKARHFERREAHAALRNAIAWYAGLDASIGASESETYRKFYFKFGVDVASCQTLSGPEAKELCARILAYLNDQGIDGNVNAELFFADR